MQSPAVLPSLGKHSVHKHKKRVDINPFNSVQKGAFQLSGAVGKVSAADVSSYLHGEGLLQNFQVRALPNSGGLFGFYLEGVKLCDYFVKAHRLGNGSLMASGNIPLVSKIESNLNLSIPDLNSVLTVVSNTLNKEQKLIDNSACLVLSDAGRWIPKLELRLQLDGLDHFIIADTQGIYRKERAYFSVAGYLRAYLYNPKDSTMIEDEVELFDTGFLENSRLVTEPSPRSRVRRDDYNFNLSTDDDQFPQVTVFSQVSRMMTWFETLGYKWDEPQITIALHKSITQQDGTLTTNNAHFTPKHNGKGAVISLGDGDGVYLQNLALDGDVSRHELAHGVIYEHLFSTYQSNESEDEDPLDMEHSGALHEGLADYFTFASTGDACLGESVCPNGADRGICYRQGRCLRVGDSDLVYGSKDYWNLGQIFHLKGQLVSGFLWDIRSSLSSAAQGQVEFDQVVLDSLKYLLPRSTYYDFLLALFVADSERGGKFACALYDSALDRGFSRDLSRIIDDCTKKFDKTSAGNGSSKLIKNDFTPSGKGAKRGVVKVEGGCGVIAGVDHQSHPYLNLFMVIMFFAFPLLISLTSILRARSL